MDLSFDCAVATARSGRHLAGRPVRATASEIRSAIVSGIGAAAILHRMLQRQRSAQARSCTSPPSRGTRGSSILVESVPVPAPTVQVYGIVWVSHMCPSCVNQVQELKVRHTVYVRRPRPLNRKHNATAITYNARHGTQTHTTCPVSRAAPHWTRSKHACRSALARWQPGGGRSRRLRPHPSPG